MTHSPSGPPPAVTATPACSPADAHQSSRAVLAEAAGVGVRYGSQWVLRGIDITLHAGDRLALIGPNGAGKTTLLKTLLGIVSPTEGHVRFSHPPPRIGYVPQRLHFDPSFPISVEEFMAVSSPGPSRWFGGVPRARQETIRKALGQTSAAALARKKLGTLSGGELQRVLIAAALLQEPQILMLDEPASNIDRRGAESLHNLLLDLHLAGGLTLVFVSHDLHWVGHLADHVACLNGTLCGVGSPAEVLSDHYLAQTYGDSFVPKLGRFATERRPT